MHVTFKGEVDEYVENTRKHNWHDNRKLVHKEEDVEWHIRDIHPFKMRRLDTLINIEEFYKKTKQHEFHSLLRLAYLDNDLKEIRNIAGVMLEYSDARIKLNDILFRFKNRETRYGEIYALNMLCVTKRDDLKPKSRYY